MSLHRRTSDQLSLPRHGRAAAVVATLFAVACLLVPSSGFASDPPACTSTWDGGAGNTYWDLAANWSDNRLPGESDVVCIGAGVKVELLSQLVTVAALRSESPLKVGGGSITLTGAAGASSITSTLTVSGAGRLVVDGDLDVAQIVQTGGAFWGRGRLTTGDLAWNGGAQSGSGTTEVVRGGPGLSLAGDWRSLAGTRSLRIEAGATAVWTSGDFQLDGGHLDNFGLFEIRGDQDLVGCCGYGVVINEPGATIRRSSGNGEVVFAYAVANRGEFDVETGRLTMQAGSPPGGDSDGVFQLSGGATLRIDGSTIFAPGSRVTGEGLVLFDGGVQQVDGTIDAPIAVDGTADIRMNSNQSIPRIELRHGTIQGDARVETPDLLWTSGTFSGAGRTVVTPGGAGLSIDSPDGHGLFSRALEVAAGADARWLDGTLVMLGPAVLDNHGLFDIPGDLPVTNCCDPTPLIHNAAGAVLRKSGGQGTARIPFRLSNDGRVEALSGTLGFGAVQNIEAGTLQGGEWLIRETLDVGSGQITRNAASLILDGPASRVQDQTGTDALAGFTENADGGSLKLAGGRELDVPSYNHDFENAGAIDIGSGSTLLAMAAFRQTAGSTTLADPTSRLAAVGGEVDVRGGRLSGPGTVDGTLRNAGVVTPASGIGGDAVTPGVLSVIGDYIQTAGGTLEMRIADAGGGHDLVNVGGAVMLAGALRIESLNGFAPSPDDEFELLRHESLTGEFDRVEGLHRDATHSFWPPDYQDQSTALRHGSEPSVSIGDVSVPEGDTGTGEARFQVSVSQPATHTVRLAWATADGSATAPDDYEAARGTITIPHGQTSAVVTVPVHGENAHEPDETFHVDLSDPTGASIARARGTATILNDDAVPPPPPVAGDPGDSAPPPDGGSPPPADSGTPPPTDPGPRPPKTRPGRCADRLAPLSSVRRPKAPRAKRRRRLTLRGTAHDRGCAKLRKVSVAVARRARVHGRASCRWMGPKGGLGRPVRCDRPRWIAVRGLGSWRLKLRRPLRAGAYLARSRAVDRAGNFERILRTARSPGGGNAVSFRVR